MANLKAIKKRIQGVRGTQQLTRAMKLVAAAKLRRAQEAALQLRPYADGLHNTIVHLACRLESQAHPLLTRREMKKVMILLYSSDRGMCGSFNLNISREVEDFIHQKEEAGVEVTLAVIGKKGNEYFRRRGYGVVHHYDDLFANIDYDAVEPIGQELGDEYLSGDYDALFVAYNWFRSAVLQKVTLTQVLPVDLDSEILEEGEEAVDSEETETVPPIFEPGRREILDELFPQYLNMEIYHALLESVASEMGARMTAMDNATNNAEDLIKRLTLIYNKARQETITTELMDIVGGAEAIK